MSWPRPKPNWLNMVLPCHRSKCKADRESEPSQSAGKRAKPTSPHVESEPTQQAELLVGDPQRMLDSRPRAAPNDHVNEWLASLTEKADF